MDVRKVKIKRINPVLWNPRGDLQPGDQKYKQIEGSIDTFGLVEPLVWNERTGNLIGGHQRLKVLIQKGFTEVDVSIVDLDPGQEKALNLALNKVSGMWDMNKLAALLDELSKTPDFNVQITGFEMPEISEILDRYSETKEDNFDFDACLNSIKTPVTKEEDLIELGTHRIFCGDSGNPKHLKTLLEDEKIQLLHTDPPYNVNYYGGNRPQANARPKKHKLWERIYSDNFTQQKYEQWLKNIFIRITPYFGAGAPLYVWNGHKQFGQMHIMLTELGFHVACIITWSKERFAIGFGDYNQQTEFCLYGWREDNGKHTWYGPNNESTLWEVHRDVTKDYIHPTQKPIALAQRAIKNSSKRGDLILDVFLGSGSTLIAAESLDRKCYGLEIDPRYVDAIIHRYIAYKGISNVSKTLRDKYHPEVANGKQ